MAFVKKIIDILLVYSTVAMATQFLYYTLIDTGSVGGSISKVGGPKTSDQIFVTLNQGRQWRCEKFKKEEGHNFHIFSTSFGRTDLKLIKKQEKLSGACSPGKFLKIYAL